MMTTKTTLSTNPYLQALVYIVILIIGIGAIAIMAFPLFKGGASDTFLNDMSKPEVARGVITFIFVLGTIAIAILLTLAILLRQTPIEEIEKRYRLGRETLSILIGVVGTIIGYYFGISNQNDQNIEKNTSPARQEAQIHSSGENQDTNIASQSNPNVEENGPPAQQETQIHSSGENPETDDSSSTVLPASQN